MSVATSFSPLLLPTASNLALAAASTTSSVFYGLTRFTHLTHSEFSSFLGLRVPPLDSWLMETSMAAAAGGPLGAYIRSPTPTPTRTRTHTRTPGSRSPTPTPPAPPGAGASVDWSALGKVTPVKDQGQCGSCYAFSAVAAIEAAIAIQKGTLTSLSESEFVDCSAANGNTGCSGGWMCVLFLGGWGWGGALRRASFSLLSSPTLLPPLAGRDYCFQFAQSSGVCTEATYPYHASNGACASSSCAASPYTHLAGYTDIPAGAEGSIIAQLKTGGPVAVAITATSLFQSYTGGVITQTTSAALNHAVLLFGFQEVPGGTSYLRLKNSWGTSWGEAGYMRFKYSGTTPCASCAGTLNVNLAASFPTAGA